MTESRDAHAVLLPVVGELAVAPWLRDLLRSGTRSVLLGETRAEYVARTMAPDRRAGESATDFTTFVTDVHDGLDEPVLVAVDQEPWGITRLHDLVPAFPAGDVLDGLPDEEIAAAGAAVATAARGLGVNMFLSPVLDVLSGANPWLTGRTLRFGPDEVGRIGAAFVTGVQSAGVLAVAKHFPGHPELALDPALHDTTVSGTPDLDPFHRVVKAGVRAIMVGPVVVVGIDPHEPASTSATTVRLLREDLGFTGVIVSDDLDTPSTTRGRPLLDTAMAALDAGVDLLLVPGGPHLAELADRIATRAQTDTPFSARLAEAAGRVRAGSVGWPMY
jgi:beta-N-acetylhexosaminidase